MEKKEYLEIGVVLLLTLTLTFVFDIIWFFLIGLVISGIILLIKKIREKGEKSGTLKAQIVCFVASIASILFGTIWYIAIALSVLALLVSSDLIKKTGNKAPKATLVLSIIGIVNCIFIYSRVISIMIYDML